MTIKPLHVFRIPTLYIPEPHANVLITSMPVHWIHVGFTTQNTEPSEKHVLPTSVLKGGAVSATPPQKCLTTFSLSHRASELR